MERPSGGLKLALGERAPYFSLPATDGRIYSLADFSSVKAFVVIFTANHCPYAQAYEQRIDELAARFRDEGVPFVLVCSNDADAYPEDNFENMIEKSRQYGFRVPYLHDESQAVARAYDAACTPEAYVFDSEHRLRYHGMIDDNHEHADQVESRYLEDALEAILNGLEPQTPLTHVIGCSIKWRR
ncbi:MAG: thioredoxin family protein [Bdellovibrionales bacterium]|nr:thioredoxin family protein [Bdellovibrionales bacterium]